MTDQRKPELELLIRARSSGPGSSGSFVTKRYVANQVALTVKPRRIPDDSFEIQAQSRKDRKLFYVIRHLEGDRYLFLNEEEHFLWEKMDGIHTLRDVATAYFIKFGSFDFRVIQRFLSRAREHKLIVIPQTDLVRRTLSDEPQSMRTRVVSKIRSLDLRIANVDERLTALHKKLTFCFSRPAFVAYGAVLLFGAVAIFKQLDRGTGVEVVRGQHALLLPLALLFWAGAVVIHELAHALTCKHFGREVKAFGFTFMNRLMPSVYADVTDMWMSTRKARMMVSFAGPLSGLIIGSFYAIVAWLFPPGIVSSFLWFAAVSITLLSLGSLYPWLFIESDGYHILSDWLRMPALREHSRKFLRERLRDIVRRRKTKPMTADERTFLWYGIASILSISAILGAALLIALRPLIR